MFCDALSGLPSWLCMHLANGEKASCITLVILYLSSQGALRWSVIVALLI